MAAQVLRDPRGLVLPPRERALSGLAALLAEAPWTLEDEDVDRLRAASLSDEEIAHAVAIVGMFSHFTRAADATAIAPDYTSPLPRLEIDMSREPLPRPAPEDWPRRPARLRFDRLLPDIAGGFARWRDYVFTATAALSEQDRATLARAAAFQLCDAGALSEHAHASPSSPREETLAGFAEKLTLTPWRMEQADVEALRSIGLDDRAVLHAIAVVGYQNQASRVRLALG
ncbi:hypothetical protein [Chondromyces apiculatus]|uniref:Carboxymuconolactone decarboxylase-like domain-containing protein n=1 Tax=Chondromyces apiculatus DSM 436 TaxID=1192034 RepID=A0A017TAQ6_9BACT|nr:hypothetical protein [Chondromyces apiculatus]EYF06368.1 Hypothetical protein CAP_1898 [Chondromyces apiculatus DSM 436]